MKVFFITQYKYLHYRPFKRILQHLYVMNFAPFFIDVKNIVPPGKYEERRYDSIRFQRDQTPYLTLELLDQFAANRPSGTLLRLLDKRPAYKKIISLLLNRIKIHFFLRKHKPKLIVLGSDIGGIYIRMIQDSADLLGIKVLIINTHPTLPELMPINKTISKKRKYWLKKFGLYKPLHFSKRTIGAYLSDSIIAVSGSSIKDDLTKAGIHPQRIVVTGNPLHDDLFDMLNERNKQQTKFELTSSNRMILVYFTGMFQEKYSKEYLRLLNKTLIESVDQQRIKLVVKFHPREPNDIIETYKSDLELAHAHYVEDEYDAVELILAGDVILADIGSSLIPQAILAGKPCLILNLQKDGGSPYRIPKEFQIRGFDELKEKMQKIMGSKEGLRLANDQNLLEPNFYKFDGMSSFRCAELIAQIISNEKGF